MGRERDLHLIHTKIKKKEATQIRNSRQTGTYERTLVCHRGSRKWQQATAVWAQLVIIIYETKQEFIIDVPLNDLSSLLMCCQGASGHLFQGRDRGESRSCPPSRPPPCSSTLPWWCSETGRCRRSWRRSGCSSTPSSPPSRGRRPWRQPTAPGSCHLWGADKVVLGSLLASNLAGFLIYRLSTFCEPPRFTASTAFLR